MADENASCAGDGPSKREAPAANDATVPPTMHEILATVEAARASSSDCDRCRDLVQGRPFQPQAYPNRRCAGADKLIAFGAHRYVAELAFDLGEHDRLGHHLAGELSLLQAHANCLHRELQQAPNTPAPASVSEDSDVVDLGAPRDADEWRQLVRRARSDRDFAIGRVDELTAKLTAAEHERDLLTEGASSERSAVARARDAQERAQKNAEGHKREKLALQAELEILQKREKETLADVERLRQAASAGNRSIALDPPASLSALIPFFSASR